MDDSVYIKQCNHEKIQGLWEKDRTMDLTPENKTHIDNMSYEGLLSQWRFAPVGDPWFQGETGQYWSKRMSEQGEKVDHVAASKRVGLTHRSTSTTSAGQAGRGRRGDGSKD